MRTRHARLMWSVPLLAALGCGGETDLTAPGGPAEIANAAGPSGSRAVEVSPGSDPVSFGTVQAPFESALPRTQTFTVTNVGTKVTSGLAVSITGPDAAAYGIKPGDDACTAKSLQTSGKNRSCTVKVTFAPSAAGTYLAALNVSVAQPKATYTVNLSGSGTNGTSIVIRSMVQGADVSAGFVTGGGLSPSSFNLVNGGSRTITDAAPGEYTVTETVPAGYDPTSLVCTSSGNGTTFSVNGVIASVTLAAGGSIDCTFTIAEIVTLRGTVFDDNDIDGQKAVGEPGRSGAAVLLKNSDGTITLDETSSDAGGLYTFSGVAPGSYLIEVRVPEGTAITSPNAQPRFVTVTNTSVSGLDFGLGSFTIAGLVNVTVNGFCGSGNPGAEGVAAKVYTYAPPSGAPTFLTSATTGSDGVFRVLLPVNAPGQGYLVEVPGVLTTSMELTIGRPSQPLRWFGCT
ncbi:MAG TPA: SdrD B-like domain-containing protein [Gemmatimonadales bacterium]|nr:SdrD B-like domain-containing protein [Gemmatimonadales bacterium]